MLAEAVRRKALTEAEAARIMASFDDGSLDISRLPPEVLSGLEGDGSLVASAVIAAALILLARSKVPAKGRAWTYDPKTRRYRAPVAVRLPGAPPIKAGALVTPAEVRAVVDTVIDGAEGEMVKAAETLQSRRVSLAKWYEQMEDMIASRHVAAGALARGGLGQLSDADRLWIRDRIVEQYEFLDRFAEDIRTGKQPLDGRYVARVRQYAQSARGTYEAMRGRVAGLAGLDEERNVLAPGDYCAGCLGENKRGWVPIGSLVPVGRRLCRSNCRCYLRFRKRAAKEAAA